MQVPLIMIGIVAVIWIFIMVPYFRRHREEKQDLARLRDLAASTAVEHDPFVPDESASQVPFDARKVAVDLSHR